MRVTKVDISFSMSVPTKLYGIAVWLVLLYRKLLYGYTFRLIKLTRGQYTKVNPEDYGRLSQYRWYCTVGGYAVRSEYHKETGKQTRVLMHRELCYAPDGMIVDHINRDGLDNREANLRPATQKQNIWNRTLPKPAGRSRYHGLRWDKNNRAWQVRLTVKGRRRSFGYYKNEKRAAMVYDRVVKKHRGQFAVLNFSAVIPAH